MRGVSIKSLDVLDIRYRLPKYPVLYTSAASGCVEWRQRWSDDDGKSSIPNPNPNRLILIPDQADQDRDPSPRAPCPDSH